MAKIDISSKEAIKNINEIIDSFNKMRTALTGVGDGSKASFRKMSTGLSNLKELNQQVISQLGVLSNAYKNVSKSQKSFVTQTRNLKQQLAQTNIALSNAKAKLLALQNTTKKTKSVFNGLIGSAKQLFLALGAFTGIQLFAKAITSAFKFTKTLDSLAFSMKAVITDSEELAKTTDFLKQITADYGAEIVTTTNRYIKFRAATKNAGLSAQETQKIFGTLTKASGVLGLKTDELQGIFLALEQMVSKGKVTTEELRRQLGERLPGAMDIMAKAVGVGTSKLDEMLKKGEVITAEVLPAFAEQVEIAFGLQSIDKVSTLQAATSRLSNAWVNLIEEFNQGNSVSNSLMKVFDFLANNLGAIVKTLGAVVTGFLTYKTAILAVTLTTQAYTKAINFLNIANLQAILYAQKRTLVTLRNSAANVTATGTTISFGVATQVLTGYVRILWATMVANPIGAVIALIGGLVIAYNALSKTHEERINEMIEENKALQETADKTKELINDIGSLTRTYNSLKDKQERTKDEQKLLNSAMAQLGKIMPDAVVDVDRYGNAIELSEEKMKEYNKTLRERNSLEAQIANVSLTETKQTLEEDASKIQQTETYKGANIPGVGIVAKRQIGDQIELVRVFSSSYKELTDEEKINFINFKQNTKNRLAITNQSIEQNKELIRLQLEDPTGEIAEEKAKKEAERLAEEKATKERLNEQTVEWIEEQIAIKKKEAKAISTEEDKINGVVQKGQNKDIENREKIKKKQDEILVLEKRRDFLLGIQNEKGSKTLKQLRAIRDLTFEILNLESKLKQLKDEAIFSDKTKDIEVREQALDRLNAQLEQQAQNERNIADAKAKLTFDKETGTVQKELSGTSDMGRRAILEQQLLDLQNEFNQKKLINEADYNVKMFQLAQSLKDKKEQLLKDEEAFKLSQVGRDLIVETDLAQQNFNKEIEIINKSKEATKKKYADRKLSLKEAMQFDKEVLAQEQATTDAEKKLAKELGDIKLKYENALIDAKIKLLQVRQKEFDEQSEEFNRIQAQIEQLEASRPTITPGDDSGTGDAVSDWQKEFEEILGLASEFADAIGGIFNGIFESRIENINAEIEKTKELYDTQIALAEGEELQQRILRRNKEADIKKLEKKRLKEQQKQAKFNKAQALVDVAINTAVAYTKTLAQGGLILGLPLANIVLALGAVQAAAVLAQPIPKYKDGLDRADKDHVAIINDGGQQEYIERGGSILTTEKENALVPIKTGDTVYKSYEDLQKKSILMSGLNNGMEIQEHNFDKLFNGIETSIDKGFKKAKINNNINLVGFDAEQNAYRDSMTNW
jgi:tape measure domain-containing protein